MKNSKLVVISLVMLINALGYGILMPLMYPFASRFGMTPTSIGLLFSAFSIAQFIATPIMGRLSDKYGRKPLLVISVFGTSLSLALFAVANSVPMLFFARILDGATGGNNSIAQAIIADSTTGKERAKAFGMLGAAFGFGFLFGPALGGFLGRYSLTLPIWIASALALTAALLGAFLLEETLPKNKRQDKKQPFFSIKSFATALRHPLIGGILLINLLSSTGHNSMVVGFQAFSFEELRLTTTQYGLLFTLVGVISVLMQAVGIRTLLKLLKSQIVILKYALMLSALTTLGLFAQHGLTPFVAVSLLYAASFTPQGVMISSLISQRTAGEDQGAMLGVNQAILSLGQIIGPILAGVVLVSGISNIFLASAVLFSFGAYIAFGQVQSAKSTINV